MLDHASLIAFHMIESPQTASMDLTGKVAVITGSSSGIGKEMALKLSSLGADVVITGLEEDGIHEVVNKCQTQYNRKAIGVFGDLTDDRFVKSLIDKTINAFNKIDILVNNAGICFETDINDPNYKALFDRTIAVNLRPMQLLTQLSVPYLVASNGCIVNTSSVNAIKPPKSLVAYCQSKSAVDMFTKCLALELGPKGVRVNSVNSGEHLFELFGGISSAGVWLHYLSKQSVQFKVHHLIRTDGHIAVTLVGPMSAVDRKWQTKYRQGETSDTSPLDKILVKALDSVRKVLSADQYERHVKHALEWLESYKAVNHYDFADKVMPYERFFDLREWDSAHAILAIFAEMSCGYDPKEHDLTDNRIYRAFNAALGRHAVLCNEIYGLKKRIRDGLYKYSYMYVIMAEEGYSAQSAMDRIVYEIHDSWTIAMNYAEQLRLMRSKELYEYVVEMVRVTKGNLYWASKCRRYQAEL
ncbi:unnamed protein product [Medioppia subpectinata]|uniref:Uncharacterized protein n=1 Tax=Medioppia subpectinata TaxID=1979941 RepID=A0A7R9PWG5_9ACAR|nr:unnamed protein product [Medioppia subpectinata]CAG2103690.1 unnamed protein product [Medioppia subpectinata]